MSFLISLHPLLRSALSFSLDPDLRVYGWKPKRLKNGRWDVRKKTFLLQAIEIPGLFTAAMLAH